MKDLSDNDVEEKKKRSIALGIESGKAVNITTHILEKKYDKPLEYTGNRKLFDSPQAKRNAKIDAFQNNKQVRDPYTGQKLVLRKQEAKAEYGAEWQNHLAEADHTIPVEKIHQKYKDDPWVTNDNIRDVTNSDENIKVISRKVNNAKRSRTNEGLVDDDEYLKDKGITISRKGKEKARQDSKNAKKYIKEKININKAGNIANEFHNAGVSAASAAGSMAAALSTMDNIIAVIKGEKKSSEAVKDVAVDTGMSAASAYVVGGATTVVAHSLSNSSSAFIKTLVRSNVPGKVVSAVIATGDILLSYSKGEISTLECITGLGERGVGIAISGYSMAVGQALIPIPLVGAAVGAMVGTAISGTIGNGLKSALDNANLANEEYEQVRVATDIAIKRMNYEREEFEAATEKLFTERAKLINAGFDQFCSAVLSNNFDMVLSGLDKIASSFGKDIQIHDFKEFDDLMSNDMIDFKL